MLLLGGVLQIAAQNSSIKQDAPVIGAIINAMSPGVMYGVGGPMPIPVPLPDGGPMPIPVPLPD
jgi:hypothetical protein